MQCDKASGLMAAMGHFRPIQRGMPIVATRVALIDVAWDVLLALLISQRESTSHWVGASHQWTLIATELRSTLAFASSI
jgi:hypothetical protein